MINPLYLTIEQQETFDKNNYKFRSIKSFYDEMKKTTNTRYPFLDFSIFNAHDLEQFEIYRNKLIFSENTKQLIISNKNYVQLNVLKEKTNIDFDEDIFIQKIFEGIGSGIFIQINDNQLTFLPFYKPNKYDEKWNSICNVYYDMFEELCKKRQIPNCKFFINLSTVFLARNTVIPLFSSFWNFVTEKDVNFMGEFKKDFPYKIYSMIIFEGEFYFSIKDNVIIPPISTIRKEIGVEKTEFSNNEKVYEYQYIRNINEWTKINDLTIPEINDWKRVQYYESEKIFPEEFKKYPTLNFINVDIKNNYLFYYGLTNSHLLNYSSSNIKVSNNKKLYNKYIIEVNNKIVFIENDNIFDVEEELNLKNFMLTYEKKGNKITIIDKNFEIENFQTIAIKYKFLLHIDNMKDEYSLVDKMSMNSIIFIVQSSLNFQTKWYSKLLKQYVHYIPIKDDLSDLREKYQWLVQNPTESKKIRDNMNIFYKSYIGSNGILDYLQAALNHFSQTFKYKIYENTLLKNESQIMLEDQKQIFNKIQQQIENFNPYKLTLIHNVEFKDLKYPISYPRLKSLYYYKLLYELKNQSLPSNIFGLNFETSTNIYDSYIRRIMENEPNILFSFFNFNEPLENSFTLAEYILLESEFNPIDNEDKFNKILNQINSIILYLQTKYKFTHYNLNPYNIILIPSEDKIFIKFKNLDSARIDFNNFIYFNNFIEFNNFIDIWTVYMGCLFLMFKRSDINYIFLFIQKRITELFPNIQEKEIINFLIDNIYKPTQNIHKIFKRETINTQINDKNYFDDLMFLIKQTYDKNLKTKEFIFPTDNISILNEIEIEKDKKLLRKEFEVKQKKIYKELLEDKSELTVDKLLMNIDKLSFKNEDNLYEVDIISSLYPNSNVFINIYKYDNGKEVENFYIKYIDQDKTFTVNNNSSKETVFYSSPTFYEIIYDHEYKLTQLPNNFIEITYKNSLKIISQIIIKEEDKYFFINSPEEPDIKKYLISLYKGEDTYHEIRKKGNNNSLKGEIKSNYNYQFIKKGLELFLHPTLWIKEIKNDDYRLYVNFTNNEIEENFIDSRTQIEYEKEKYYIPSSFFIQMFWLQNSKLKYNKPYFSFNFSQPIQFKLIYYLENDFKYIIPVINENTKIQFSEDPMKNIQAMSQFISKLKYSNYETYEKIEKLLFNPKKWIKGINDEYKFYIDFKNNDLEEKFIGIEIILPNHYFPFKEPVSLFKNNETLNEVKYIKGLRKLVDIKYPSKEKVLVNGENKYNYTKLINRFIFGQKLEFDPKNKGFKLFVSNQIILFKLFYLFVINNELNILYLDYNFFRQFQNENNPINLLSNLYDTFFFKLSDNEIKERDKKVEEIINKTKKEELKSGDFSSSIFEFQKEINYFNEKHKLNLELSDIRLFYLFYGIYKNNEKNEMIKISENIIKNFENINFKFFKNENTDKDIQELDYYNELMDLGEKLYKLEGDEKFFADKAIKYKSKMIIKDRTIKKINKREKTFTFYELLKIFKKVLTNPDKWIMETNLILGNLYISSNSEIKNLISKNERKEKFIPGKWYLVDLDNFLTFLIKNPESYLLGDILEIKNNPSVKVAWNGFEIGKGIEYSEWEDKDVYEKISNDEEKRNYEINNKIKISKIKGKKIVDFSKSEENISSSTSSNNREFLIEWNNNLTNIERQEKFNDQIIKIWKVYFNNEYKDVKIILKSFLKNKFQFISKYYYDNIDEFVEVLLEVETDQYIDRIAELLTYLKFDSIFKLQFQKGMFVIKNFFTLDYKDLLPEIFSNYLRFSKYGDVFSFEKIYNFIDGKPLVSSDTKIITILDYFEELINKQNLYNSKILTKIIKLNDYSENYYFYDQINYPSLNVILKYINYCTKINPEYYVVADDGTCVNILENLDLLEIYQKPQVILEIEEIAFDDKSMEETNNIINVANEMLNDIFMNKDDIKIILSSLKQKLFLIGKFNMEEYISYLGNIIISYQVEGIFNKRLNKGYFRLENIFDLDLEDIFPEIYKITIDKKQILDINIYLKNQNKEIKNNIYESFKNLYYEAKEDFYRYFNSKLYKDKNFRKNIKILIILHEFINRVHMKYYESKEKIFNQLKTQIINELNSSSNNTFKEEILQNISNRVRNKSDNEKNNIINEEINNIVYDGLNENYKGKYKNIISKAQKTIKQEYDSQLTKCLINPNEFSFNSIYNYNIYIFKDGKCLDLTRYEYLKDTLNDQERMFLEKYFNFDIILQYIPHENYFSKSKIIEEIEKESKKEEKQEEKIEEEKAKVEYKEVVSRYSDKVNKMKINKPEKIISRSLKRPIEKIYINNIENENENENENEDENEEKEKCEYCKKYMDKKFSTLDDNANLINYCSLKCMNSFESKRQKMEEENNEEENNEEEINF